MSANESYDTAAQATDARSRIKLVRNAKGFTQVEVSIVVGDDPSDVDAAQQLAQQSYDALCARYGAAS